MRVVTRTTILGVLLLTRLGSAPVFGNEVGGSRCSLTNVTFPRGNVLVWMACLQRHLADHNTEYPFRITLDVSLPVISNAVFRGDETAVRELSTRAMSNIVHSLEGKTPALGLGISQGPTQIGAAPLEQILDIIQISFKCQVRFEAGNAQVRLFPPSLVINAYRLDHEHSRHERDVLAAAYGGDGHDPLEGVLYDVVTQGIVYVLAPPDRHDRAARELAALEEQKIACPVLINHESRICP